MGRRIPLGDDPLIHPAISFSLIAAAMAATIAIITGLCGLRKKPSPDPSSPPQIKASENPVLVTSSPSTATAETSSLVSPPPLPGEEESEDTKETQQQQPPEIKELPLPPAMNKFTETYSCNNLITKSASMRKPSSTLSVKVPRSLSFTGKRQDQEEKQQRKKGKLRAEDSVLIKPIILGEKCRVPPDEDDAVIYDKKGKRIATYHPKSSCSFSLQRTTSTIDQNSIPS